MIKVILIIVILPGTWQPGREMHAPFDSMDECKAALARVFLPDERGWSYCTSQSNETWYYENQSPAAKSRERTAK